MSICFMEYFDTKTEEAFFNLMKSHNANCHKIQEKSDPHPDFVCELNNIKVFFELKDLNESGTTKWLSQNMVAQNITIAGAVSRFLTDCKKKFLPDKYANDYSALVITNLRPLIRWDITLIPQIEKALQDNLNNHPEIGNVILTGYDEKSNSIEALHIYTNKSSKRIIPELFFKTFKHKYYTLK